MISGELIPSPEALGTLGPWDSGIYTFYWDHGAVYFWGMANGMMIYRFSQFHMFGCLGHFYHCQSHLIFFGYVKFGGCQAGRGIGTRFV